MRKRREEEKAIVKTSEWDKLKYPVRVAWEVAVLRSERAQRYAKKFPDFIRPDDLKFQEVAWQYENEGIPFAERERGRKKE